MIAETGHERQLSIGYTYSGHPVSCSTALKNIEIIEREGLLDRIKEIGPYFMERLATLRDLPMVGDVRGSHLMAWAEFVAGRETKRHDDEVFDVGARVANACEPLGVLVRPMVHLNVMSRSLVITSGEIDTIVAAVRGAIVEVRSELDRLA